MKSALSYIKYFRSTSQSDYLRYDKPERHGNHYSCNHFLVELLVHIPDETHGDKVPEHHRTTDSAAAQENTVTLPPKPTEPDNNPAARPTTISITYIILKLLFLSLFHHKSHTGRLLHATYSSYNLQLALDR